MVELPDDEKSLRTCLTVSTHYQHLTGRQTSCQGIVRAYAVHCASTNYYCTVLLAFNRVLFLVIESLIYPKKLTLEATYLSCVVLTINILTNFEVSGLKYTGPFWQTYSQTEPLKDPTQVSDCQCHMC